MDYLPESKLKEFQEAFELYDKDRDGHITIKELTAVLRTTNSDITHDQIQSIISQADTTGTGKLNLEDFVNLMSNYYSELDCEEEVINAFRVFDKEGKGTIPSNELKHVMTTLGDKLTNEEVDEMIREADTNGDGIICYEDFVRAMMAK